MEHNPRPLFALVLRLGSALCFGSLLSLVKYAGQSGIALPEIMFWRQCGVLPWITGWLLATGNLQELRTTRIGAHAGRAVAGMSNMVMNFGSYILLPLAEATVLGFTSPLFAVLIAAFVLRQHIGPWRWTAVALGFAGVLIIAQPGPEPINPLGAAMGLGCAFVIVVINFQIRDLGRTETPIRTVFWFSLFGTLLTAPAMPFYMTHHTPMQWLIVVMLGALGAAGQLLMTASLRHGAVISVIIVDYTTLIWTTLAGWLVWHKLPPHTTILGTPLIIGAGIVIAWREHRLARRAPKHDLEPA